MNILIIHLFKRQAANAYFFSFPCVFMTGCALVYPLLNWLLTDQIVAMDSSWHSH
jgi:hypothetical protein